VSILLAAVVVAGVLAAGLLALSQAQKNADTTGNNSGTFINPNGTGGTATPNLSPIFSDPLTSNAYGWDTGSHCFFKSDGFHEKSSTQAWACVAPTDVPDNFTAQVELKQISGATNQGYGIDFRRTGAGVEYRFAIDGYGHWTILSCNSSKCTALSNWTSGGGALKAGLNQENTIEVTADGSHFEFFANGTKIGQIVDSTYSSGSVALAVGGPNMEVVYKNLVISQIV